MKPLIICAAVTGGAPARSKTPHHPVTPDAVAEAAVECWRAGAGMVHIHARLEDGSTSNDPAHYAAIRERIERTNCDAVLNFSAGDNGGRSPHEERLRVVESGAEVVSLDVGSFNMGNRLYNNAPSYLREMAKRMSALGIVPGIEVFDTGHLHGIEMLAKDGLLKAPYFIEFIFGPPGALHPDERQLQLLVDRLPEGSEWSVSAQSADHTVHLRLEMAAFSLGGHVRTGMEDCVYVRPGELAKTNAQMVEQWVQTANIWRRPVASPADIRAMLGLPARAAAA